MFALFLYYLLKFYLPSFLLCSNLFFNLLILLVFNRIEYAFNVSVQLVASNICIYVRMYRCVNLLLRFLFFYILSQLSKLFSYVICSLFIIICSILHWFFLLFILFVTFYFLHCIYFQQWIFRVFKYFLIVSSFQLAKVHEIFIMLLW